MAGTTGECMSWFGRGRGWGVRGLLTHLDPRATRHLFSADPLFLYYMYLLLFISFLLAGAPRWVDVEVRSCIKRLFIVASAPPHGSPSSNKLLYVISFLLLNLFALVGLKVVEISIKNLVDVSPPPAGPPGD